MRTDSDFINVIIVNWNGRPYLRDCLRSLEAQTLNNFSITFVDNNSKDGSVEYVKRCFPNVNIVPLDQNYGFAAGNNIGLKLSDSKYIVTLNNDTVVHEKWLESLASAMEKDVSAGSAASKMLIYDDHSKIDRAGDAYTTAGVGKIRGRNYQSDSFNEISYIFGACAGAAIYRRSMLDQIGFFDENFFLLYEDIDLSFRAQLKGFRCIYTPDAIVYHRISKSIERDSYTSIYYSHRNLEWVFLANMPRRLLIKYAPYHIVYIIIAFVYFILIGNPKAYVCAKIDAIKGIQNAIKKRKNIQKNKYVCDRYIESLFDRETIIDRLFNRI